MATSLDDIDQLEILDAEREVKFRETMLDLFGNEDHGLHVYFQRNERNVGFINELIGLDHKLDATRIFEASKDDDGFVDPVKVIDELLRIYSSMGEIVLYEDPAVFEDANLSKGEFMGKLRAGITSVVQLFDDSQTPSMEYFLGHISHKYTFSTAETQPRKNTLPPPPLDLQPLVEPADTGSQVQPTEGLPVVPPTAAGGDVSPDSQSSGRRRTGLTLTFERDRAVREMIDAMGIEEAISRFPEDQFFLAIIPEVARFIELTVRRNTKKWLIRRTPSNDLDKLIHDATANMIGNIQDELMHGDNRERLIAQIILAFYRPGKERLRTEFERRIKDEVTQYFRTVHATPETVHPAKNVTQIPRARLGVPPQGVVRFHKTERPVPIGPVVTAVVDQTRVVMQDQPPKNDDGDMGDEKTLVNVAPFPQPAAKSTPPPAVQPAPQQRELPPLVSEVDDEDTITAAPLPSVPPKAPSVPPQAPSFPPSPILPASMPPAERIRTAPDSQPPRAPEREEVRPPIISYHPPAQAQRPAQAPAHTRTDSSRPAPAPAPKSVPAPAPQPSAPPAKRGFFSRARKWIVGASLAVLATIGIHDVSQTKPKEFQNDTAPTASTASSNDAPKKAVTSPVATAQAPVVSATAPDVKSAPVPVPQVTSKPDVTVPAPEVASVLTTQTFSLGSSEVSKPFTGKASMVEGGVDATPFAQAAKTPAWYQTQKKSADTLLKIYDSHKSQLDKDTVTFIEKNESVLRDLASQKDFTAAGFKAGFEIRHGAQEVFGANGVYNNLLAFQRIVNLYGGDSEKIVSDGTIIKFAVGSKLMAPEQRFAKAVLYKENSTVKSTGPTPGMDIKTPAPAPTKNPHGLNQLQKNPQKQVEDPRNYYGFNYQPMTTPVQQIGLSQGVNLEEIDAAWDTIAEQNTVAADLEKSRLDIEASYQADLARESAAKKAALRAELNKKMDRLFAKAKEKQAAEAKMKSTYDDAPDIEVSTAEMHPAEMVEIDRRAALLERGEIVVRPVEEGGTGSVLMALENGFMKECRNGDQMDRVQQRIAKIRMGSLEEYEVLGDGKIYARLSSLDLEDLQKIVA